MSKRDLEMEMHDSLDKSIARANVLVAENHRMRATLREAGNQFHLYADLHLAKQPPEREKAATNLHWAMRCHEAAKASDTVA